MQASLFSYNIYATLEDTSAISILVTIINDTHRCGDVVRWEEGSQDTFVKPAAGWRFRPLVHGWKEVDWIDNLTDMLARNLE